MTAYPQSVLAAQEVYRELVATAPKLNGLPHVTANEIDFIGFRLGLNRAQAREAYATALNATAEPHKTKREVDHTKWWNEYRMRHLGPVEKRRLELRQAKDLRDTVGER